MNYAFVANLFQRFANAEGKKKDDDSSSSSSSDSENEEKEVDHSKSVGEASIERIRELEQIIHELQTKLGQSEENFKKYESELLKRVKELEAENKKLKEELEAERRRKEREEEDRRRDLLAGENEKEMRLSEQEREINKLRDVSCFFLFRLFLIFVFIFRLFI